MTYLKNMDNKTKNTEIINRIIASNNITDYLATKNILPIADGERLKYSCPLHKEKTPSFIVYKNGHESFYCFGCKVGGTIINLISYLEHISFYDAVNKLGGDIDISDEAELKMICECLKKSLNEKLADTKEFKEISANVSLNLSLLGNMHLKMTDYDDETFEMLEKLYKSFDENVWNFDINSMEEFYKYIVSEKLFIKRLDNFKKEQIIKKRKLLCPTK